MLVLVDQPFKNQIKGLRVQEIFGQCQHPLHHFRNQELIRQIPRRHQMVSMVDVGIREVVVIHQVVGRQAGPFHQEGFRDHHLEGQLVQDH